MRTLLLMLVAAATTAGVSLEGTVVGPSGAPVAGAQVLVVAGEPAGAGATPGDETRDDGTTGDAAGVAALTDTAGRFVLSGIELPATLVVTHPLHRETRVEIDSAAIDLVIELALEPTHFEEVEVLAVRGGEKTAPVGVVSTVVKPVEQAGLPSTLTEVMEDVPAVSENGQGGVFQNLSIRGISRQRVMHRISGVRITSERRAGASTSFIDPALMGTVDVFRGPVSSTYGSGALGGVVQVFPRNFDGWTVATGYETEGDQNVQALGTGGDDWSVGLARRQATNAEAADGSELNTAFTQYSAVARKSWGKGPRRYRILAIPTLGEDIGKANTDYPDRITVYPREQHNLVELTVEAEGGWQANAFVHPHELETDVFEDGVSHSSVESDTFDFGGGWQQERALPADTTLSIGVDAFGRRSVDTDETLTSLDPGAPGTQTFQSLDDGEEDEAGLFATLRGGDRIAWEVGGRFSWMRQENAGADDVERSAWNGFAGVSARLKGRLRARGHLGTGNRFPSLTERFFIGTTGRGQVIGNPGLHSERAISAEAGLSWVGKKLLMSGAVFHNRIENYIERLETMPDLLTFVNLSSGTIEGVEWHGHYRPTEPWDISWGGHIIEGRDDDDEALADIPVDQHHVGLKHQRGRWTYDTRLAFRNNKSDPGSGEKRIGSAELLSASIGFRPTPAWEVWIGSTNLLDEEFFRAADRKAPLAQGRSFILRLRWIGG